MRLTPAQIAIRLICGERFPRVRDLPLAERLPRGRRMLVELTGVDFGYDLAAWHAFLNESRAGGYTYSRRDRLPRIMQTALASQEWLAAVRGLTDPST